MKIKITENQEQLILNSILKEDVDYSEKRLLVKKYLDDNFQPGVIEKTNTKCFVTKQEPSKTLDKEHVFYKVQAKFRDILPSEERDDFLKDAVEKWASNKISKAGSSLNV